MVSALSARLLADYKSDGSRTRSESGSDGERDSSGGYSADREGNHCPPGHISLQITHKRTHHSDSKEEKNKRRKFHEEQYAASVAKDDMKKGNVKIPPIETERSRITLGKVDMAKVKLMHSNDIDASPFLVPASQNVSHIRYDFAQESVYNALLNSCRRAYELLDAIDTDSTDSFSDTESDYDQGFKKEPVIIKPRIEDAIPPPVAEPSSSTTGMIAETEEMSDPPAISMTMDEALTVCNFSRLMTLATAPYTVVHSNAACGQLTGLSSTNILGKPLFSGENGAPTLASCAESSAAGKDVSFSILGHDKKVIECQMKVTPIVSSMQKVPKVTHYAVDLTAIGQEMANEAASIQAAATEKQVATTVVG